MLDVSQLLALVADHKWAALAAVLIGLLIRLSKEDYPNLPTIPARYRGLVSFGLGGLYAVADAIAQHKSITQALIEALIAGGGPILGHELVVEGVRNGKEVIGPSSKADGGKPQGPYRTSAPPPPEGKAPPSAQRVRLIAAGVLAAVLAAVPACGLLHAALPAIAEITSIVTDAEQIIAAIEADANAWFIIHPDAEKQASVTKALGRCHVALDAVQRAAHGTQEADSGAVDAAFADFRAAYVDLTQLLAANGVKVADRKLAAVALPDGGVAAAPVLKDPVYPTPLALSYRGHK